MKTLLEERTYDGDLVQVVGTRDYNGQLVATAFASGYPVLLLDYGPAPVAGSWQLRLKYEFLMTADAASGQTQAAAAFASQFLGEGGEQEFDAYARLLTPGSLQAYLDSFDGHELVAFAERVETALQAAAAAGEL